MASRNMTQSLKALAVSACISVLALGSVGCGPCGLINSVTNATDLLDRVDAARADAADDPARDPDIAALAAALSFLAEREPCEVEALVNNSGLITGQAVMISSEEAGELISIAGKLQDESTLMCLSQLDVLDLAVFIGNGLVLAEAINLSGCLPVGVSVTEMEAEAMIALVNQLDLEFE